MKIKADCYHAVAVSMQKLELHDRNVSTLNTLAVLLGCYSDFFTELPDGKRPDVLRYDSSKRRLFIGDAKNTETPRNRDTQKRLFSYMLWLSAYVSKPGRQAVFAICFRRSADLNGWVQTVHSLAVAAEVGIANVKFNQLDAENNLVWFSVSS